jgi:hypothetical protein
VTGYREYQIRNLEKIFGDASMSPVFKPNDKYPTEHTPRIAYSDVMNWKCVIRDGAFDGNGVWDDQTARIIAEYRGIDELVDDGWRLD